jgi:biotin carboxyl carrier protein
VRPSAEVRSALHTLGNAAMGVGLGMSVLGVAFVVSQFAAGQGGDAQATSTPPAPPPTPFVSSPTPASTPPAPPTTPTPAPTATPDPFTATAYSNSGKRYAALRAPIGYTFTSPVAGTVTVRRYQFVSGEVRLDSLVPGLPFFPYVTLESADRRIIFRPGALDVDTELSVKDGDRVAAGAPLFKVVGDGASSWHTFYDRGVTASVIASVMALPSGAELDPVAFFTTR